MNENKTNEKIPNNRLSKDENNNWCFVHEFLEKDFTMSFKKYEFKTKKEAERSYLKIDKEYNKKINEIKNSTDISFSFKSYLQYWLYNIQYPKVANRRRVVLNHMVNNIIIPSMTSNPLLSKITSVYLNELFVNCNQYSETSGWMSQLIIGSALKSAIADQYLKTNPMDAVKKIPRNKPKFEIIERKDIPKFLTEAKLYGMNSSFSEGLLLEILLALFCGLRRGEIMGLKFDDFNPENQTVTVKRQLIYETEENIGEKGNTYSRKGMVTIDPKTKNSYRCLKIHPVIFDELEERRKIIEIYKQRKDYIHDFDGYICVSRNGRIKSDNTILTGIKKIAARSGVPLVSPHDLRHTCATMLLEFGVEITKIAKILGHRNPHTTLDIYCTTTDSVQDIADLFNGSLVLSDSMKGDG